MKEAYYFSHDSNARNDPKILSMTCDYGMVGYGRFWIIVENLREQNEFKLKHNKSTWKALSVQMQCTIDETKKFIDDCINEFTLFDISEDFYFYSNSLLKRMDKYQDIKKKRIDAANKRWENNAKQCKPHANALQNDANEMKLNEIKLNNKDIDGFFESVWILYPKKEGKGQVSKTQKEKLYGIGYEKIKNCVDCYVKAKKGTEKQFLQNGSTFFNSGYIDYLSENPIQEIKTLKPIKVIKREET